MLPVILCIVAFSAMTIKADSQQAQLTPEGSFVYLVAEPDILGRALRSNLEEGKQRFSRFGERAHFPYYRGLGRK